MKNWNIQTADSKKASIIANSLKMNENIASVFVNRGLDTPAKVKEFLDFNETDIPDISLLQDANIAIERIGESINLDEHIVIYADYDADGTCSASVMLRALRNLGANVDFYTNDRLRQGFGMKVDGVDEILKQYPDVSLIITVDNGIVAFDAAEHIKKKGIDLIITDHHEPDVTGLLPEAVAVVDHKRFDDVYPFKELCGTGIAYRLMKALYERLGKDLEYIYDLLPLVAIGTVADCVSMTKENRYYVKQGLAKMGDNKILALGILSSLFKVKSYNEDTIGFYYGPMINSNSRLIGNAIDPIKFFTTDDYQEAFDIGLKLYTINERRKEITNDQMKEAEEQIINEGKENNDIIIVYNPSFDEGIVGIIAGRITEKYHKPSIVFTDNNGMLKGSARSVEGFNIKEAFDELSDIIYNYGGHAMAAGITIELENLDEFDKFINNNAYGKIPDSNDDINVEINLDTPNLVDITLLDGYNNFLRPFGTDWPKVKTRVGGFTNDNCRYLKDIHLKLTNTYNGTDYSLLMFNNGVETYKELLKNNTNKKPLFEAIGDFDINVFNGTISYQLIVQENQLRIQK